MSFKSETIINLKDLILDKIFNYNDYLSHISDIDMYNGYLQNMYIFDIDCIDDDVQAYKNDYPKWSEAKLKSIIEDNVGNLSSEKMEEIKRDLGEAILHTLLPSGTKEVLEKYGIKLVKTEYWTPKFYNYESDRLDIHLEDMTPSENISEEIKELIQKFIDAAPKSCDGYINLLPNSVEECKRLDIPHIFAILYKEGILEDMVDNVEDYISYAQDLLRYEGHSALQECLNNKYNQK